MAKPALMSFAKRRTLLAGVEKRREVLVKQVRAVCQGYTTALFVHGPGGLGKTHLITTELDDMCGKSWVHHTAYSTPRALFSALQETPQAVHLFEDCERLYKMDVAASILRAACGGSRGSDRWITYETANEKMRLKFTGGIIIVSNESIARGKGPLQAVASRFRPVKWDMTNDERIATILGLADEGYDRGQHLLSPAECRKVADFLIEEMVSNVGGIHVDLRTYMEHALPAYAQWLDDPEGATWKDVLRSKLLGEVEIPENREERTAALEGIAWRIHTDSKLVGIKTKISVWTAETGLAQSIYYRHLASAKKRYGKPTGTALSVIVKS